MIILLILLNFVLGHCGAEDEMLLTNSIHESVGMEACDISELKTPHSTATTMVFENIDCSGFPLHDHPITLVTASIWPISDEIKQSPLYSLVTSSPADPTTVTPIQLDEGIEMGGAMRDPAFIRQEAICSAASQSFNLIFWDLDPNTEYGVTMFVQNPTCNITAILFGGTLPTAAAEPQSEFRAKCQAFNMSHTLLPWGQVHVNWSVNVFLCGLPIVIRVRRWTELPCSEVSPSTTDQGPDTEDFVRRQSIVTSSIQMMSFVSDFHPYRRYTFEITPCSHTPPYICSTSVTGGRAATITFTTPLHTPYTLKPAGYGTDPTSFHALVQFNQSDIVAERTDFIIKSYNTEGYSGESISKFTACSNASTAVRPDSEVMDSQPTIAQQSTVTSVMPNEDGYIELHLKGLMSDTHYWYRIYAANEMGSGPETVLNVATKAFGEQSYPPTPVASHASAMVLNQSAIEFAYQLHPDECRETRMGIRVELQLVSSATGERYNDSSQISGASCGKNIVNLSVVFTGLDTYQSYVGTITLINNAGPSRHSIRYPATSIITAATAPPKTIDIVDHTLGFEMDPSTTSTMFIIPIARGYCSGPGTKVMVRILPEASIDTNPDIPASYDIATLWESVFRSPRKSEANNPRLKREQSAKTIQIKSTQLGETEYKYSNQVEQDNANYSNPNGVIMKQDYSKPVKIESESYTDSKDAVTLLKFDDCNNTAGQYQAEVGGLEPFTSYAVEFWVRNDLGSSEPQSYSFTTQPSRPNCNLTNNVSDIPRDSSCVKDIYNRVTLNFNKDWCTPGNGTIINSYEIVMIRNGNCEKGDQTKLMDIAEPFQSYNDTMTTNPFRVTKPPWNPTQQCCLMDDSGACSKLSYGGVQFLRGLTGTGDNFITVFVGDLDCGEGAGNYCVPLLNAGDRFSVLIRAYADITNMTNYSEPICLELTVPEPSYDDTGVILAAVLIPLLLFSLLLLVGYLFVTRYRQKVADQINYSEPQLVGVGNLISIQKSNRSRKRNQERGYLDSEMESVSYDPPKPIPIHRFNEAMNRLTRDSNFLLQQELDLITSQAPSVSSVGPLVALMPENQRRNRFANAVPFNHNRVKLQTSDQDYINASFIKGYNHDREYIASMGPIGDRDFMSDGKPGPKRDIAKTIEDFWTMVWEQRVEAIAMLTECQEGPSVKCARYWPSRIGEPFQAGPFSIRLMAESISPHRDYIMRLLDVSHELEEESRRVSQFHFVTWKDFSTPPSPEIVLEFDEMIRSSLDPTSKSPILVHCSAGVGRTGTFIAVDILLQRLQTNMEEVDVYGCVAELRKQRVFMVKTEKQYLLVYRCLAIALQSRLEELRASEEDGYKRNSGRLNYRPSALHNTQGNIATTLPPVSNRSQFSTQSGTLTESNLEIIPDGLQNMANSQGRGTSMSSSTPSSKLALAMVTEL